MYLKANAQIVAGAFHPAQFALQIKWKATQQAQKELLAITMAV